MLSEQQDGKLTGMEAFVFYGKQKSHLLNCKCDTFVNITSPTQLQDGTTYDSNNIIHHICMKSISKLFKIIGDFFGGNFQTKCDTAVTFTITIIKQ